MNRVLIMVISLDKPPYDEMTRTSKATWDSVEVEGVETLYYFGISQNGSVQNGLYLPVVESLYSMGHKDILAFEWVLKNKDFDYVARVNSNTYVNKKELINYVQGLPGKKYYAGLTVNDITSWSWAGCGLIISRDVIQTLVDNKDAWDHKQMEDKAMSLLVKYLGIPLSNLKGCSIDRVGNEWLCLCYGPDNTSFTFTNFEDIKTKSQNFYYRCKQDYDRKQDRFVMEQLFKHLQ